MNITPPPPTIRFTPFFRVNSIYTHILYIFRIPWITTTKKKHKQMKMQTIFVVIYNFCASHFFGGKIAISRENCIHEKKPADWSIDTYTIKSKLEMFLARKPCVVSFRSNAFPWKWALMMSICVSNKIHLFFKFFFVLKLSIFHNFPMPDKFSTKFVCLLLQKWNLAKEQQQQHKLSNINLRKLLIY